MSKKPGVNITINFTGDDAERLARFAAEHDFETPRAAGRALVLAGIEDWPRWGIDDTERRLAMVEFRAAFFERMNREFIRALEEVKEEFLVRKAADLQERNERAAAALRGDPGANQT